MADSADNAEQSPEEQEDAGRGANGRFQPGFSGNPGGRPKGKSIVGKLRQVLDGDSKVSDIKDADIDSADLDDGLALVMYKKALGGDHRFMTTLLDRLDGKVKDGDDGQEQPRLEVNTLPDESEADDGSSTR